MIYGTKVQTEENGYETNPTKLMCALAALGLQEGYMNQFTGLEKFPYFSAL